MVVERKWKASEDKAQIWKFKTSLIFLNSKIILDERVFGQEADTYSNFFNNGFLQSPNLGVLSLDFQQPAPKIQLNGRKAQFLSGLKDLLLLNLLLICSLLSELFDFLNIFLHHIPGLSDVNDTKNFVTSWGTGKVLLENR